MTIIPNLPFFKYILCPKPCLYTWSRSDASNFMLNHVKRTHSAFILEYEASLENEKKQKREKNATFTQPWNHLSGTTCSHTILEQQKLERTMGLFICKGCHSLRPVEQFLNIEMMLYAKKQMNASSRTRLTNVIILASSKKLLWLRKLQLKKPCN